MFHIPLNQVTFDQIVQFCQTFPEGVRVEYKRQIPTDIPKIISSFANTAGGICVIGVETDKVTNRPRLPITGMPSSPGIEEQIVQSAHTGIYPSITPDVQVVGVEGKPSNVVVVVKVPESIEAPHAVEKSTRVYIRVASTSSPYDLADIDRIEYLLKRRQEPEKRREELINQAEARSPFQRYRRVRVIFTPIYPRGVAIGRDMLYERAQALDKNGMEYVRGFRRIGEGIMSSHTASEHILHHFEANIHGVVFFEERFEEEGNIEVRRKQTRVSYTRPIRLLYPVAQLLNHAVPLLQNTVTNVLIRYELFELGGLGLVPERPGRRVIDPELALEHYGCIDSHIAVSAYDILESLPERRVDVLTEIMEQVLWAFNYNCSNLRDDVVEWLRLNKLA